jgi:hypothetical protein
MKHYWFKAKQYGWGWYPSSWQGFLVLLGYFLLLVLNFMLVNQNLNSPNAVYRMVLPSIVLTILLIVICYITGEQPRWRWGN